MGIYGYEREGEGGYFRESFNSEVLDVARCARVMGFLNMRVIFLIALFQFLWACRRKQESDQGDQIAPQIFYWPDGGCVKHDDTIGDAEK